MKLYVPLMGFFLILSPLIKNHACAEPLEVHFKSADLEAIRDIRQIQGITDSTVETILMAPVVQLATASNPTSMVVSLMSLDLEQSTNAARNIQKIAACKVSDRITMLDINEPLSEARLAYFNGIRRAAESVCRN